MISINAIINIMPNVKYSTENKSEIIDAFKKEAFAIFEEMGAVFEGNATLNGTTLKTKNSIKIEDHYYHLVLGITLPSREFDLKHFLVTLISYSPNPSEYHLIATLSFNINTIKCASQFRSILYDYVFFVRAKARIIDFGKENPELTINFEKDDQRIKKQRIFIYNKTELIFSGRYYNKQILKNLINFADSYGLNKKHLL